MDYSDYVLRDLLTWPALRTVLYTKHASRRVLILSGVARTGKSGALQRLPARLPRFRCLTITLPRNPTEPVRKASWRAILVAMLLAQDKHSETRNTRELLEEVAASLRVYDVVIMDQVEGLPLPAIEQFCTLLRISECTFLLVGREQFWRCSETEPIHGLTRDMLKLDENDVWAWPDWRGDVSEIPILT